MGSWKHVIRGSLTLAAIVTAIMLATHILTVASAPIARAAGLTPREIAITDDEAGRQAARAVDKDGEDGRSSWSRSPSTTRSPKPIGVSARSSS